MCEISRSLVVNSFNLAFPLYRYLMTYLECVDNVVTLFTLQVGVISACLHKILEDETKDPGIDQMVLQFSCYR